MSELRDYQKKMLGSKSKVVFCNWDRGEGKTYSICEKILRSDGKCLCISDSNNYNKYLESIFEEKRQVKIIKSNCREMELWFGDESIYITFVKINDLGNCIGARFDNVFFDEVIPNKDVLDSIIMPMVSNQVYIMKTIIEGYAFEYIDSNKIKESKIEWIDKQIEDLMNEFGGIAKNERTTMTREKVLGLIENLIKIKANYNCKQ